LEHFQEKWKPVFRFENATTQETEHIQFPTECALAEVRATGASNKAARQPLLVREIASRG
jgi:hypothetical protein